MDDKTISEEAQLLWNEARFISQQISMFLAAMGSKMSNPQSVVIGLQMATTNVLASSTIVNADPGATTLDLYIAQLREVYAELVRVPEGATVH